MLFVSSKFSTRPCVLESRRCKIQTFYDSTLSTAQRQFALSNMKVNVDDISVTHVHPSEAFTYKLEEEAKEKASSFGKAVKLLTEKHYRRFRAKQKQEERELAEAMKSPSPVLPDPTSSPKSVKSSKSAKSPKSVKSAKSSPRMASSEASCFSPASEFELFQEEEMNSET